MDSENAHLWRNLKKNFICKQIFTVCIDLNSNKNKHTKQSYVGSLEKISHLNGNVAVKPTPPFTAWNYFYYLRWNVVRLN